MAEWQGRSGVALCHPSLTSAGKAILTKAIRRAGWSTDQFTSCQPHDIPAGTRAIVALGDQAQEALTGWFGGKRSVKYTRGYLLQGFSGLPVVPTFDPTQLAQGQMKLLGLLMNDIGVALQAAVGARKVCLDPKTVTNYRVGLDALRELYAEAVADPNLLVAFDLETATSWGEDEDESIEFSRDVEDGESDGSVTSDSDNSSCDDESTNSPNLSRNALDIAKAGIRTVQFSLRPGTGVSCDWSDECRDWVQRIMQLPNPFAGHNCFHRHTSVWMSDGSWKPIWQVKIGELVRSVTVEGKLCDRKVTDLVKVYDNRPWVEVKTDGAHNKGLGKHGSPGTVCTPDHQWYVPGRGWKRADQLEIGNTIYLPREGGWDLILGCALGDGHCTRETNALRIAQANKEYSLAKASALGRRLVEKVNKGSFGDTGTLYETCTIIPKCLRDKLYNNDGTRNWIEPTMRALAIWYCDDGNLSGKFPRLSIDRYRKQGIQIQNWFTETFGPTSLYKEGTLIAPRAEAAENFFEAVANFIPPSMQYKLPEKYQNRYDGWIEVQEPQLGKVIEVKERPEILSQKFGRTKYCLTVEGTHSFFTRSGLVRNCWLFDEPILRNHGMEIPEGTHDTLWLSHHLQPDLPKHLQGVASWINFPFPWKHMSGADLDFYGSVDVDSVQWIMRDLPPKLKRLGLWEGYERYVRQFRPVLAAMEKRGIPVSKSKLEELRTWLGQEITRMDSELQPMIPTELKGRKVWKSWPADTKPFVEEYKQSEIAQIKSCLEAEGKKVTKKALSLVVKPGDLPEPHRSIISEELGYEWDGDQLYKTLDFNPRSSDQILQFIRAKGYPVPKRFKDQKDTTSDKELERLEAKTKDPVLSLVRSIRAYSKMGNAYAGKLREDGSVEGGWYPGPDGRLRATFSYGPATGQLSAKSPNVLTTPKRRAELANKFRQCIVAEPGHKLVELDYTAFHARTLGLAAQDAAYMKLAAMDIHSFVAGHMIKYPGIETALTLSDGDLKQLLEEIKSKHKNVRNFKAKPAILGIGFKMGKRRLYYENRDSYESEAEAGKLISLLHELFPNVFKWQDAICEKADKDGRLINSWGACRWFWDVMKWTRRDGQWVKSTGRDAEKATAYLPSSNAHFMLRDKLLQANSQGWLDRYGLINVIHDAVLFHCPTNLVDECVHNIKALMEAPVLQMADLKVAPAGFTCGAEAMVGSDWSNMEEVH